jgi:hypothetical protein
MDASASTAATRVPARNRLCPSGRGRRFCASLTVLGDFFGCYTPVVQMRPEYLLQTTGSRLHSEFMVRDANLF